MKLETLKKIGLFLNILSISFGFTILFMIFAIIILIESLSPEWMIMVVELIMLLFGMFLFIEPAIGKRIDKKISKIYIDRINEEIVNQCRLVQQNEEVPHDIEGNRIEITPATIRVFDIYLRRLFIKKDEDEDIDKLVQFDNGVNDIIANEELEKRHCPLCQRLLSFEDFAMTNRYKFDYDVSMLLDAWKDKEVEFACCTCYLKESGSDPIFNIDYE